MSIKKLIHACPAQNVNKKIRLLKKPVYPSAAGKRVGNKILDTFDGPVGMLALFLLSQASEITSMASTASRKISSNNVVGSKRTTLPEIKAGVSITYCEVFGSSRRRSIAQVMNYQSGHSGRYY